MGAPMRGFEEAFHGGERGGLMAGDEHALAVAGGEAASRLAARPGDDADAHEGAAELFGSRFSSR